MAEEVEERVDNNEKVGSKAVSNEQVERKVLAIRESKIGSALPISVEKITLRNFHFLNVIVKSAWMIPAMMITYQGTANNSVMSLLAYLFYVLYAVDIIASFIEYYRWVTIPAIIRIVIPLCKLVCILISITTAAIQLQSYFYYALTIVYFLVTIVLDVLHLFYSELDRIDTGHGLISSKVESDKKFGLLGVHPERPTEEVPEDANRENRFTE